MFDKFIEFQVKYSKILFFLILLLFGFSAYIAKDVKIDPDFGSLISDDSEFNINDRKLKAAFEQDEVMLLYISYDETYSLNSRVDDIKSLRVETYTKELQKTLLESQYVLSVSEPQFSQRADSIQMLVFLSTPNEVGALSIVKKEIDYLVSLVGKPVGLNIEVTGFPVIIDRIPTLLINDNIVTIFITIFAIFFILYWYSRDVYFSLATLSIPVFSFAFFGALLVYFGVNITITLAAVGVLILGLGSSFGIHISTHYSRAIEKYDSHLEALKATVNQLKLPITASFVTTLAGFIALIFGVSPSSQSQGLVLAIGITVIFLTTFLVFPIIITIFASHIQVRPNFIFMKILNGLGNLARYQVKYAKLILWGLFFVTFIMLIGASQVQFSTSNSNWIPDDDPVQDSFTGVINDFGGNSDSVTIILESEAYDLRNFQVIQDVYGLKKALELLDNVDSVRTPYDSLFGFEEHQIYEQITNNQQLRSQFNRDFTLTRIVIISQDFPQDEAGNSVILEDIELLLDTNPIYYTQTSLYGNLIRFKELGESLQSDAVVTTLLGLGLVFFVASTIYASLAVGLLSLIPIIVAVIWAVGLMGFFGIPFTSLSTGIISLVLGIGIDFSIHLVDSIKKYSKRMNFKDAVFESMSTSGRAIFIASLTTFVGFLALTFAQLLGTQRLGWSLAFSILSVFVVTILFVPCVMSLLHKRELKKQRL